MTSALLLAAVLGGCVLLLWLANRIEPHWVSKNGERLICYGQGINPNRRPSGRWRELRISRASDDTLEVRTRRGSLAVDDMAGGDLMRLTAPFSRRRHVRQATYWKVAGPAPSPDNKRVIYMLDGNNDPNMPELIAIRLPTNSRAIPMLEELRLNRQNASQPSPRTSRSADRPDPD